MGSGVCDNYVRVSVCPLAYLRSNAARSFSGVVGIPYVFPVLQMTSCFRIMDSLMAECTAAASLQCRVQANRRAVLYWLLSVLWVPRQDESSLRGTWGD